VAMPDVFSIRQTTVEAYLEPVVHEIKVRRGDLLGDLRQPNKRAAYLQLGGECWYVLAEGIGSADDVPPECGVIVARADALEVTRPAPRRAARLPLAVWMALARATPEPGWRDDEAQAHLVEAEAEAEAEADADADAEAEAEAEAEADADAGVAPAATFAFETPAPVTPPPAAPARQQEFAP